MLVHGTAPGVHPKENAFADAETPGGRVSGNVAGAAEATLPGVGTTAAILVLVLVGAGDALDWHPITATATAMDNARLDLVVATDLRRDPLISRTPMR